MYLLIDRLLAFVVIFFTFITGRLTPPSDSSSEYCRDVQWRNRYTDLSEFAVIYQIATPLCTL